MSEDNGKKADIRNAAKQLFFHFGFAKTSMDDIAKQSGMAKPTLYYYYENKEMLFEDVVLDEVDVFLANIARKIPDDIKADIKLIQYLKHFANDLTDYVDKILNVPGLLETYYPQGKPVMNKIARKLENQLDLILREGMHQGVFYKSDRIKYTKAISFMIHFLNVQWLIDHKNEDVKAYVDTMIDIILNGIRRRV